MHFLKDIHHQPGERTNLLVVPRVHSNRSVGEVLSHVSFQPQNISRIHQFFHCSLKVTNNSKLQVSFGTRSKECQKILWKLALNNNHHVDRFRTSMTLFFQYSLSFVAVSKSFFIKISIISWLVDKISSWFSSSIFTTSWFP